MIKDPTQFNSLFDLLLAFPNELACIKYLEDIRWRTTIVSPFDATSKVYRCKNNRFKCKNTGKYFNVRTGTIYEDSKIALQKWFIAMYLIASHKKGISSHQLARDLRVTQKTAWFMLHRIRYTFNHENFKAEMGEVVQCDESFVGGKNKNRHRDKKVAYSQGRSFKDKTPVMGMESNGKVRAFVVPSTKKEFIIPLIYQNIKEGSTVVSDEWSAYKSIGEDYNHQVVDHQRKQYLNDSGFTTNSIEGFWTHLKRSLYGIYHSVSRPLLQRYVDEAVFRYNTRTLSEHDRFNLYLSSVEKRLKYKDLIKHVSTNQ